MNITDKDRKTLLSLPNRLLADYHARILLENVSEPILTFYENNKDEINGLVVIVRNQYDLGAASHARNTCDKVLFVFSDNQFAESYFSGVSKKFTLSNALIKRSTKW